MRPIRWPELAIAALVIAVVVMLIVPVPRPLLDALLALNIAISVCGRITASNRADASRSAARARSPDGTSPGATDDRHHGPIGAHAARRRGATRATATGNHPAKRSSKWPEPTATTYRVCFR